MTQGLTSTSKLSTAQKNMLCNFSEYFSFPFIFQNPGSGIGRGVTFIVQVYELRDDMNDPHPGVATVLGVM